MLTTAAAATAVADKQRAVAAYSLPKKKALFIKKFNY